MHGSRSGEFLIFIILTGISALIGLLVGWLLPSLLLGLLGYTALHIYRLTELPRILLKQQQPGPLFRMGLWAGVTHAIDKNEADRRLHEHELLQTLEYFRSTVAALPDAAVILQATGEVVWSNNAAFTLLGLHQEDSAGQLFSALVRDPLLDEYLSSGDYSSPLILYAPGDRTKILLLQVIPIGKHMGQQVLVARDISRQHHIDEAQRDFIANISHELRTPLTVITGLLEQLGTDELSTKRITAIMQRQADRMRDLISDLLTLTRIGSDTQVQRDESVDVPEMLTTILEEAHSIAAASGHVLIPEICPDYGLRGNSGELRTAFTNLVVNAIRHTPNRAEIRIRWTVDEDGARFCVTDTGEGIAPRHIPRLGERFYRIDSSRSRDTGGTGLGLAIVRQVLKQHDASLEVSSKTGHGSTFCCCFPVARTTDLRARG